jgi:hypothetical protein
MLAREDLDLLLAGGVNEGDNDGASARRRRPLRIEAGVRPDIPGLQWASDLPPGSIQRPPGGPRRPDVDPATGEVLEGRHRARKAVDIYPSARKMRLEAERLERERQRLEGERRERGGGGDAGVSRNPCEPAQRSWKWSTRSSGQPSVLWVDVPL